MAVLLVAALVAASCGAPGRRSEETLVFDGTRPYRVLVEEARLGVGPRDGESRFLAGWRPWLDGERLVMGGDPRGAKLRIVTLEARPRRLRLELLTETDPPLEVSAHRDGTLVGRGVAQDRFVDIELPEMLPAGVQTLTLTCSGDPPPPFDVVDATLTPSLSAGRVTVLDGDLVQRGTSVVEVFVPASTGAELLTALEPGAGVASSRVVTVTATAMDGSEVGSFRWSPEISRRPPARIAVPLAVRSTDDSDSGLVRLRFGSLGDGQTARWLAPRLRLEATAREGESQGPRSGPEPPRLVILYVMDALRADHLASGTGAQAISPELEELIAEGFELRGHRSLAPSTLPSTRALLTGSLRALAADAPQPYLAEAFRRAGYRTGLFSGNPFVSKELGLDRGFEVAPEETHFDLHALRRSSPHNDNAEVVHAAALDWLDSLPPASRVFLYVHTMHPHNPYAPPPEIGARFVGASASPIDGASMTLLGIRDGAIPVDDDDREKLRALYAGGVAYNGAELRAFLARLEERFERDDVLLVLTSDHGEELFDHGGVLHGYTLYEEQLRVPLVVRWPGQVRPGASDRLTTTLDLRRTLLELAGAPPDDSHLAAASLLPLLLEGEDDSSWDRRSIPAAALDVRGGLLAVRQGPWKLVFAGAARTGWGMGQGIGRTWEAEYLFHLGRDPREQINVLGDGGVWEDWLRTGIDLWDERFDASGTSEAEPSEELRRRLESLGYVD